ncbi:MAG TPA: carboxyl transferase domain-containing protein [Myxococcota bacterium]|nr:carboxyl transferase domain-containing protein [Myxococcota bacterium]
MSWKPELEEIERRSKLAQQMGGEERVSRARAAGRLTVRERIERLLDPGSFHETGALAGRAEYDASGRLASLTPSNFVCGTGRIDGRRVVVGGDDFTVRGGAADGAIGNKMGWAEKAAYDLRLPLVRLVDGTGGGGSVKQQTSMRRSYVPALPDWNVSAELLSRVPVAAAALGPVAGLGAARVAAAHFSVMVRGTSQVFVAGPPVVRRALGKEVTKEELGGVAIHARGSGVVDNEAASEDDALAQVRRFLSYLPASVFEAPPRGEALDDPERREEALLSLVPRERRKTYDVRKLLELVLDRGSIFELARGYGRPLVTVLARLDGVPAGVMANDPRQLAGAPDADASQKMTRFVDFCDQFHLPVVNFVDNPGFLIGPEAEKRGTVRQGVRALIAVYQARVPWCSVIVRRVFGVAGAGHGQHHRLNLRYAWPSGEWGSLPIEGGVEAAYRRQLEVAADPEALRKQLEEELASLRSPFLTAEAFGVEEIIDPRDTRPLLVEWVRSAYTLVQQDLGVRTRGLRV